MKPLQSASLAQTGLSVPSAAETAGRGRRPLTIAKPIRAARISIRVFSVSCCARMSCCAASGSSMPPISSATMTSTTAISVSVKPRCPLGKVGAGGTAYVRGSMS
jgi:hypothetical protein